MQRVHRVQVQVFKKTPSKSEAGRRGFTLAPIKRRGMEGPGIILFLQSIIVRKVFSFSIRTKMESYNSYSLFDDTQEILSQDFSWIMRLSDEDRGELPTRNNSVIISFLLFLIPKSYKVFF
jgi:hypothetical protein